MASIRTLASTFLLLLLAYSQAPRVHTVDAFESARRAALQQTRPDPAADPHALPAIEGLLALFQRYPVVALAEGRHAGQQQHDFMESLIRDPRFPGIVNDVVVEFGNALYQPVIDRYLAGGDVRREELRQVWRNTTQPQTLVMEAPVYESFFATVRAVNRSLPPSKHLRVWLGDPPIDWSKEDPQFAVFLRARDAHFAAVVEREILARGRNALLISGGRHFARNVTAVNAAARIEQSRPGTVFIAEFHDDLGPRTAEIEQKLSAWPQPGFAPIKGTWLGALDPALRYPQAGVVRINPDGSTSPSPSPFGSMRLEEVVDGYVYVGPAATLTLSPVPSLEQIDGAYRAELERRRIIAATARSRRAAR